MRDIAFVFAVTALIGLSNSATIKKEFTTNLQKGKAIPKAFKYVNCEDPSKKYSGNISNIFLGPDPLSFPGNLTVAFNMTNNVEISKGLKVALTLSMKVGGVWIEIPCVHGTGSCTYDDVCPWLDQLFSSGCPPDWKKKGIPCKCPFTTGNYVLPMTTYQWGSEIFPTGDYRFKFDISHAGTPTACAEVYVSFKQDDEVPVVEN